MEDLLDLLAWIIGAVIVVLFSWNFYNQESYYLDHYEQRKGYVNTAFTFLAPVLPRFATSRTVYIGWYIVFLVFTLGIYLLIAKALSQTTLDMQQKVIHEITGKYSHLSFLLVVYKQLLAALIVTSMNNILPRNFDILTHFRRIAHRQAKIPEEARAVYKRISSGDLRLREDQKRNAIAFVGEDSLRTEDFDAKPGTIERNWGIACHLLKETANLTKDLGSLYSTNLHNPKLQYDSILANFENLKLEIKNRRNFYGIGSDSLLAERITEFLKQTTHMVICLVFLSEPSRTSVFSRWNKMGVFLRIRPKFKVNGPATFIAIVSFLTIVAVVSFCLGMFIGGQPEGEVVDATYAFNTAVASILVICIPMLLPLLSKLLLSDYWPVRGQFTQEYKPALYPLLFIVGVFAGLCSLYLTSLLGFFDEPWKFYRPYALLSGGAAMLMAFALDRHPRVLRWREIIQRSIPYLLSGTLIFLIIGIAANVWSEGIAARDLKLTVVLADRKYLFILIAVLGAIVGFTSSCLSDLSLRIKSEREEIGINLSEYLLPVVGYLDFSEMNKQQVDELICCKFEILHEDFISYLEEKGVLVERALTEYGYNLMAAPRFI